jgi:hypothetical protein
MAHGKHVLQLDRCILEKASDLFHDGCWLTSNKAGTIISQFCQVALALVSAPRCRRFECFACVGLKFGRTFDPVRRLHVAAFWLEYKVS